MDEQTPPPPESTTTTPDPVMADTPATEPTQVEPVQVPIEPISTPPITAQTEPVSEPIEIPPEAPTPQMEGNEALLEIVPELTPPTPIHQPMSTSQIPETGTGTEAPVIATPPQNILKLLLTKARLTIQLRKQKKLLKVMTLFTKKTHITNSDVAKLLHVSDATALRYISQLEKENKIVQVGKTGQAVTYTKR